MLQLMGWDFMNLNYYLLGIINEQILCDFFFFLLSKLEKPSHSNIG